MAQVITIAGEKLFATKAQANQQLDIDTFIFANVAGQDPTGTIDRNEGIPNSYIVHQQNVQQTGRINDNVVVYSTVLDSVTGPFEFNWVGLYSSINQTLVAISHVPTVAKTITAPGSAGNTLNRNFGIEYSGIADLAGISVSPETWQLDFTARLSGMDELTRQLASDMNGKDWFIDDGFKVVPRSTANTFSVTPGVGYVSGLRVELKNEKILTLQSYPQFVYVDAYFDGNASSQWEPQVVFTVSNTEMDDYIDVNGIEHYVFKLVQIIDVNTINDFRSESKFSEKSWVQDTFIKKLEADKKFEEVNRIKKGFMSCINANTLAFSNGAYQPNDINQSNSIKSTDANTGVLVKAEYGAYLDLVMPYAVLIGDSIAEGHPEQHGRLHPSGNVDYMESYKSQVGQLSFELSNKFTIPFLNHGIGGQTSVDIKSRWERDVLHQIKEVGDGRGNQTMNFGGQLPHLVYLHVGINDISIGIEIDTMKNNFRYFAQSCKDNNIILMLSNIGAYALYNDAKEKKAREFNTWLQTDFKSEFEDVEIIDYLHWSTNGTGDYKNLKDGMFADNVHPNKSGYIDFASYIADQTHSPIILSSLYFDQTIYGPNRFSNITKFSFNNKDFKTKDSNIIKFNPGNLDNKDNPIKRITLLEFEVITGDGIEQQSGFCQVYGEFTNKKVEVPNSVMKESTEIVAAGVIYRGELSDSWKNFGIKSIDKSDLLNGNIKLELYKPANLINVSMIGDSPLSHELSPRWKSGSIGDEGSIHWSINLKNIKDGTPVNDALLHNYQIFAYIF
ncbi:phage tail protein [Pseudoalteromonas sp. TB41]|uniref:phage tail-collar fiber domain-containing protein n=1 Tax=Pseudoalteromonas sp. TB41 TaxID=985149 RepID=UPI0004011DA6|nr:phage tail protein [Pseudoalteromonas sp. TB41]